MSEEIRPREHNSNINNPHDKGYKYLLSSEKVFLELLQSFVNVNWVRQIDPKGLTRIDKSYVLQDFHEKEADLVYRVKLKDQEVIFYLLLEMQSTVDFQMPYRLYQYMGEIWRDVLKNTDPETAARKDYRLPAIIPIILYNGADNWTACRQFKECLAGAEQFGKYVVDFEYFLIDVNRYSAKELLRLGNLIGGVFFLDQKKDKDELLRRLEELIETLEKLEPDLYRLFAVWLKNIAVLGFPETYKEAIGKVIDESNPKEARKMVSNLSETLKKAYDDAVIMGEVSGIEKGVEQAKQEIILNMLSKKMDEKLISEITGLPIEKIGEIKRSKFPIN
jgi:predicted transposase/invertase (TIGR01784 family)